jgi:hypothetical protein
VTNKLFVTLDTTLRALYPQSLPRLLPSGVQALV